MEKGLYIVATNPLLGYEKFTECCVRMNVPMLQLRDKSMDGRKLLETARAMRDITRGTSTKLVINDRADIAFLCDADYLHIGLSDIKVEDARKIVGDMKIGISAETYDEALMVDKYDVDYIGAGPVFATPTKSTPVPPLEIGGLAKIVEAVEKPVVAIGGIFPSNLFLVRQAGASGWAMVRQFMQAASEEELIYAVNQCMY